jgi:hypothetical protein
MRRVACEKQQEAAKSSSKWKKKRISYRVQTTSLSIEIGVCICKWEVVNYGNG